MTTPWAPETLCISYGGGVSIMVSFEALKTVDDSG
jgi:hypothetical protein